MATPIVICDDSAMARKQLARALPPDWDVDITFAANGQEAIDALERGLGEVMFLDLTMPVMDGYETLEEIKALDLSTLVVVVSGDIQEEAYRRVMAFGAVDFIKKPADPLVIEDVLQRYGIFTPESVALDLVVDGDEVPVDDPLKFSITLPKSQKIVPSSAPRLEPDVSPFDCYREITNVAMGRAGDLLARLTGEFVQLPVPKVAMLEPSELQMALAFTEDDSVSAVCQGFIGTGIAGEALLIFSDASFESMARLMKHEIITESVQIEVLTDVSGALLGAILNGLGEQLNLNFSQSYPTVLGQHTSVRQLIDANVKRWRKTLTIEVTYHIENYSVVCDVLLLFTEDSVASIDARLAYMMN